MEVTYKKDINHTYILFQGEQINTEMYQIKMATHNLMSGLLPCSVFSVDGEDIWRCECTGMQSLESYCQNRELKKEELVWILEGILKAVQEMQDFLMDVNSLYLTPGEIYIQEDNKRIYFCMVPFYDNPIWNSMGQILQFLLHHLDSEDSTVASLAYGFFRLLSANDCSMERLWALLYEKTAVKKEKSAIKEAAFSNEARSKETATKERAQEKEELLDEFFSKENEVHSEKRVTAVFLKKILYLFPAIGGSCIILYLFFNSWTMSIETIMTFAIVILLLFGLSGLLFWKWGRSIKERNPLLEPDDNSPFLEEDLGTVLLSASGIGKRDYLIRGDTGERFELKNKISIIGKKTEVAQILVTEPTVSRIHAKITRQEKLYYIQDLNSKNGTYVNGSRLEGQQSVQIHPIDEILIAGVPFYLELSI